MVIDGVKFRVAKDHGVKATIGQRKLGYHFVDVDLETITSAYTKYLQKALDHFGPRFHSFPGDPLDEQLLKEIAADATLTWLRFYNGHRKPLEIPPSDWDHPTSWRIIQWAVKDAWPRDAEKVATVTAHLLGLSRERYARWLEAEERFQNR